MQDSGGKYLFVANLEDVPTGKAKCFDVKGRKVLAVKVQGNIYAFDNECSHEAKPLEGGRVRGASVVCPLHGARFDLNTGKSMTPPAVLPIAVFPTKVEKDKLYCKLVPKPKAPQNPFASPGSPTTFKRK